MRDKRILITGGAGLIGSHIADLVAQQEPAEIVILDNFVRGRTENLSQAMASHHITIVDGDICDVPLLGEVMQDIDIVFHQAAIRITQCAEEPRLAFDVLANGTFNVIEAAVAAGVEKVVAASSASVLGLAESFPTTESHHPYNNSTIYGAAKAFNEAMLRSFTDMYGLRYVALRYFNVYGPRMDVFGRLHRSADPLDGAHRDGPAADHLWRWHADHGFCPCPRHRPRQHAGRDLRCYR
jgi:UDP-glucose 4-epimerase